MKQKKNSSPKKDELGIIDFIPTMKPKVKSTRNINSKPEDVKQSVEAHMTMFFSLLERR